MSDTPSSMGGTWFPWTWPVWTSLAPQQLSQPINPGWTFGNVFVTAQNSSAPQTKLEIVLTESYGRKMGSCLMQFANCELIEEKDVSHKSAFEDVIQVRMRVDKIKKESAKWRTD